MTSAIARQRRIGRLIAIAAGSLAICGMITAIAIATPPAAATHTRSGDDCPVAVVASVGITVSDLDAAVRFYSDILTFRPVSDSESAGQKIEHLTGVFGARVRTAHLRLGEEHLELTQFLAPEGRPVPADSRSNDRWFQHVAIVVSDIDKAYERLRAHHVRHASSGPQTLPDWNPNAGGISAFYFKDPDGHVLEIIHFPKGKGNPRWQIPSDKLFLGIDHTAIVVSDTERSLAFYRDTLGLRIAGTSENYGTEQEHLNNVFGARLRITALHAPAGPGIELLEYLAPAEGRDYPADTRDSDLLHWHTTFVTSDADALLARLREAHTPWVSPGIVSGLDAAAGFGSGAEVKDPDGHVIRFGQASESPPEEHAVHADGTR